MTDPNDYYDRDRQREIAIATFAIVGIVCLLLVALLMRIAGVI